MDAQIFATCVKATASVAVCVKKVIVKTFWRVLSYAIAIAPIGSAARNRAYVAVAMSLSPPE
jgi:hypothetical protein